MPLLCGMVQSSRPFLKPKSEQKRVINKVHLGPGEGHFEMPIPQDVGEDVWIIPSNKSLLLLEPLQRQELFNLKIGSMWAQILGAEPISAFISCLFICSWGFGRSSGAAGASLEGRK